MCVVKNKNKKNKFRKLDAKDVKNVDYCVKEGGKGKLKSLAAGMVLNSQKQQKYCKSIITKILMKSNEF